MIEQIVHTEPGGDPAAIGLALAVASALHAPTGRAAELAPATATHRAGRAGKARCRAPRV